VEVGEKQRLVVKESVESEVVMHEKWKVVVGNGKWWSKWV
jgi:hypothetical protein